MKVRLVWITPDAESVIAYCARVSNPANQESKNIAGLLKYCIEHKHWSVFEMANACLEVETSRAISPQILRHTSFKFQEFSQRYAETFGLELCDARRQDLQNRQNSIDDLSEADKRWFEFELKITYQRAKDAYDKALSKGIAKECARMLLPMATKTRLYMNGSIRSWIHYIQLRTSPETQKEHRNIALSAEHILAKELPVIAEAAGWRS